ncbi:uncharacterized protein LY89DRAFT_733151 [Mollisia scopiformis]|uniref:CCHC-type domain-containing protein n=1 Tax=Mollisia scopiformis TaxID=149040 RepID=A0A194XAV0_MOLSC|nr:uncharacterized protein LY89DRAFT_733151 [Mollisia scopiformis]KUJ17288.1 hypothetical protein LY89DRAFT_733151 [Mollisia scopiformis]
MAYKGKNDNGKKGGNKGAGAKSGGNGGGKKHCDNCGPNNTHVTADCFKNKKRSNDTKQNPKTKDSAKPPSRPCSHCGGPHYDNQCPNNTGGQTNKPQNGKTPSRPCKHCQQSGHFDSACPTLTNNASSTVPWQNQNQPFNQPCPSCGQAHHCNQCPNRPQLPQGQYVQTTTEVYGQLGALINALQANPSQANAIIGEWQGVYGQQQQQPAAPIFQQQQPQAPAFSLQPLAVWHNNGEDVHFAQPYEETSMFGQQAEQRGTYMQQWHTNSTNFGAVPDAMDRDGDVVMSEWDYLG